MNDLTLAQVQALDAGLLLPAAAASTTTTTRRTRTTPTAAWDGRPSPRPPGYTADDFQHPTIEQVLDAFPNTPINIEIKMIKTLAPHAGTGCQTRNQPVGPPLTYCDDPRVDAGGRGAGGGAEQPRRTRTAGTSSSSPLDNNLVDRFNELAPHVAIAPGTIGRRHGPRGRDPQPRRVRLPDPSAVLRVPDAARDDDAAARQRPRTADTRCTSSPRTPRTRARPGSSGS